MVPAVFVTAAKYPALDTVYLGVIEIE